MKGPFAALLLLVFLAFPVHSDERNFSFRVAWNNPFNPAQGQETRFEYVLFDQDGAVKLLLYSADGRLVRRLADHIAQSNTLYSQPWNGRNENGQWVDSGLYFAVLESGDASRKVRRVVVRRE